MPRVMLVESHAPTREICCRFLRAHGHEVVEARNGLTALRLAREGKLDAVVTDWVLPDMNIQQFLEDLTRSSHAIPVIVYSNQPHLCPFARLAERVQALISKTEDLTNLLVTLDGCCGQGSTGSQDAGRWLRSDRPGSSTSAPHFPRQEPTQC